MNYRRLAVLTCLASTPVGASVRADIEVNGAVDKPAKWTAASLRTQFAGEVKIIQYTNRGEKHSASCIALSSILHQAGADSQMKMGPGVPPAEKNKSLRLAIVVSSFDGYTASFSLAELLPDLGNTSAWLALDSDGKSLPEGDGHVRLIVPSDKKPARSVRDVAVINVVDASK